MRLEFSIFANLIPTPNAHAPLNLSQYRFSMNDSCERTTEASFLEAAVAASVERPVSNDVESQIEELQGDNIPQEHDSNQQTPLNGISKEVDEETISTFQDILTTNEPSNCWILNDDDEVPFPSVNEHTEEYNELVNVCPCRCLFFTLKETICMVMSALGCAVFVTGLVFLCMFLEGSWFQESY